MTTWRFAAWNVGSMTGRGRELEEKMGRRNIEAMRVQESKWRGEAVRELGERYKIWSGNYDIWSVANV